MKFKIYYQENNKLKTLISDTTDQPLNIIKIVEIKEFKEYFNYKSMPYSLVVDLFKEMSIILNTNLTLEESIDILLQGNNHQVINDILLTIKTALYNAQPIHLALKKHKNILGNLPILFFQLAQNNGNIKDSISALSTILIENQKSKKQFLDALKYPIVLLISLIISMGIIFHFVLPRFEHIFVQFGDNLPFATKSLLYFNSFIQNNFFGIVLFIFVFIIGFKYLYYTKQIVIDKIFALHIPLVSKLYQQFIFYRFFLSLSMLLKSKYTFQIALENTKHIVNNKFILSKINEAINDIKKGTAISTSFKKIKLFDNLVLRLLLTAQETNTLPLIIENITNIYQNRLSENIKLFSTAISPIFILLIAILILWIVFALMLPIWGLGSVLN